jgi:hypothetical protein
MRDCMGPRAVRSRAANTSRMNEADFIRQQLRLERTHLREILRALRPATTLESPAQPVARYLEWAGGRLIEQVLAHHGALQAAAGTDPTLRGPVAAAGSAARQAQAGPEGLLALLEAWSEPLDAAAGRMLRISHWRRAAHLTADSIIEERELYAAARGAVEAQ